MTGPDHGAGVVSGTLVEITDLASAIAFTTTTAAYTDTIRAHLDDLLAQLQQIIDGLTAEAKQYETGAANLKAKGLDGRITKRLAAAAAALTAAAATTRKAKENLATALAGVVTATDAMRAAKEALEGQLPVGETIAAAAASGGVADRTTFYSGAVSGTLPVDAPAPDAPAAAPAPAEPEASTVPIPAEAHQAACPRCGDPMDVLVDEGLQVDEDDGKAGVLVRCRSCRMVGGWSWPLSREEYEAHFGRPPAPELLLPGDPRLVPPPPDQRVLPPGPWGATHRENPAPIPDEAWAVPCSNKRGWGKYAPTCGAMLVPQPDRVFFYDEFASTATVGFRRCDTCRECSLEFYTWPLTPEEHRARFGRAPGDYRPEYDPTDPDDFVAEYSMWETATRKQLQHFRSLEHLTDDGDYDLRAFEPGEYRIKHWPSGTEWDVPAFVAAHEGAVPASEYVHEDEDDEEER